MLNEIPREIPEIPGEFPDGISGEIPEAVQEIHDGVHGRIYP